ncbi:MAG: hypothetical protein C4570_01955, partial [Ammonifex sp.]
MEVLIGLLTVVLVVLLIFVVMLYRKTGGGGDLSAALQNLTHSVQSGQAQTAVLAEKLAHLEPLPQTVTAVQLELRGLGERVSTVEQNQNAVSQG